jgi:NADH-quinone oxidoreductase subunit N
MLVDGLQGVVADWHGMLIVLALLSVSLGNVVAIAQDNIKRMLAYSTIAHMGYLLLGVLSGNATGYAASMFYVLTYALMSLGTFGMIIYLSRAGFESDKLNDFKGLSQRSPWFAMIMMILMFSLAGVPPFLGFWAKWFVFKEVVAAGYVWLAALAVVFSIIGAYYYLRLVKLMYFDLPEADAELGTRGPVSWVLSINGLALLVFGLAPGSLMNLCLSVLKAHG